MSHAPCQDTCKQIEKEKVEKLEMQLKGIQLKKEYLEEAKKYPTLQNSKVWQNNIEHYLEEYWNERLFC